MFIIHWLKRIMLLFLFFATCPSMAQIQLKVFDSGPGLLTAINVDDDTAVIYDAGHWYGQKENFDRLTSFIGDRSIALMVLSHSDADHISLVDELVTHYPVGTVLRTGLAKNSKTWKKMNELLVHLDSQGQLSDRPIKYHPLQHGQKLLFNDKLYFQFLSGFHKTPAEWGLKGSEYYNGNSIVMRLEYKGFSVLFTGDAVGRHEGDPQTASPIATEAYLIANQAQWPIKSDVMIAPHHGSDDGSSLDFIKSVAPRYAIFSAGSQYQHPRKVTAERYIMAGLDSRCLLRTDLGDSEGGAEWSLGSTGKKDGRGDDGIVITLSELGVHVVQHNAPIKGC